MLSTIVLCLLAHAAFPSPAEEARRYQQEAYDAFETVAELLIPARKQE